MDELQIRQLARGNRDDSLRLLFFPPPFSDINNAVAEHLERARTKHDSINITAQYLPQAEPTRICYLLSRKYLLGYPGSHSLGEVRVRARRSGESEIHLVSLLQAERRELTQEESVALMSAEPGAWDQLYEDLKKKRDDERDLQHAGALFFHQQLVTTFLQSLLKEIEPLSGSERDVTQPSKPRHNDMLEPDLTPREQYGDVIAQARARAAQNGLSADIAPTDTSGDIEKAEWFLAFWVPLGKNLEQYTAYIDTDSRTFRRNWDDYRKMDSIPKLRELGKMSRGES